MTLDSLLQILMRSVLECEHHDMDIHYDGCSYYIRDSECNILQSYDILPKGDSYDVVRWVDVEYNSIPASEMITEIQKNKNQQEAM